MTDQREREGVSETAPGKRGIRSTDEPYQDFTRASTFLIDAWATFYVRAVAAWLGSLRR